MGLFAGIFEQTFQRLQARGVVPQVLYPAVQLPSDAALRSLRGQWQPLVSTELQHFMQAGPLFVSINRFERKKVSDCDMYMECQACQSREKVDQDCLFASLHSFPSQQKLL